MKLQLYLAILAGLLGPILMVSAMEMPTPVQPRVYNVPSLKFLAAQSLAQSQSETDINGVSLAPELKQYTLFMKHNDQLLKKDLDWDRHDRDEMYPLNPLIAPKSNYPKIRYRRLLADFPIEDQKNIRWLIEPMLQQYRKLLAIDHAADAQTLLERACLIDMLDEDLLADLRALNPQLDLNGTKVKTLMAAAHGGYVSLTDFLLEHGADINHELTPGRTAVRFCCYMADEGHIKVLALLCQRGANVNLIDDDGKTALLSLAAETPTLWNAKAAELLLKHGANIDYQEPKYLRNAVRIACHHEDTLLLKTLLKYKPNLELRDHFGRTAFIIAAQEKNIAAMQLLKSAGAHINVLPVGNQFFKPALIHAAMQGDTQVAFNLLEWGTNVDTMDNSQETALIHATRNNNNALVRLLLEYNASIHARDIFGKTPLMVALEDGNFDLAQILLDHIDNFPQEQGDQGNLYLAFEKLVKTDRIEMLKQMLAKGAYTSLQKDTSLNIQLLKQATPAMRELLQNYRSPEYYQLSWHARMLFDARLAFDNNRAATLGTGAVVSSALSATAWYLLKKR